MTEAFEKTRAVVEPLLAQNDSGYEEEQFDLVLNQETGEAVLYLPYTDAVDAEPDPIDVEQLAADAVAAAEATPGAAPVVPVIGTALIDELDAVAVHLFTTRTEWSTGDVYWTFPEPDTRQRRRRRRRIRSRREPARDRCNWPPG